MKKVETFRNCKIAKSARGTVLLIEGPKELTEIMDGDFFEDNCSPDAEKYFPQTSGFYICDVELWFEQGFFEGFPAPGESDRDLLLKNVRPVAA